MSAILTTMTATSPRTAPGTAAPTPLRPAAYATPEDRWQAVAQRDAGARGAFLYAVKTTGVYCLPGCASRTPRRENVTFFESARDARSAGYRACLRCRPDEETAGAEPHAAAIARACRQLEAAETVPDLAMLAAGAGLSRAYFHRLFTRLVGVTPRQYAAAQRLRRLREGLRPENGESVTGAIYGAGYGSSSRAYEAAPAALGMTPGTYRRGAPDTEITYATARSSLGWVLVAATERGLCAIELGDSAGELESQLRRRFPNAQLVHGGEEFAGQVERVVALVELPGRALDLPLDVRGTAFQQRVWAALRQIPPGETASYTQIAARIGQPGASRAVAQACGANTLAIAIPCHRVVRTSTAPTGSTGRSGETPGQAQLGGYRWGIGRKQTLLQREATEATAARR